VRGQGHPTSAAPPWLSALPSFTSLVLLLLALLPCLFSLPLLLLVLLLCLLAPAPVTPEGLVPLLLLVLVLVLALVLVLLLLGLVLVTELLSVLLLVLVLVLVLPLLPVLWGGEHSSSSGPAPSTCPGQVKGVSPQAMQGTPIRPGAAGTPGKSKRHRATQPTGARRPLGSGAASQSRGGGGEPGGEWCRGP